MIWTYIYKYKYIDSVAQHYWGLIKVQVGPLPIGSLLVDQNLDVYGLEILIHKG